MVFKASHQNLHEVPDVHFFCALCMKSFKMTTPKEEEQHWWAKARGQNRHAIPTKKLKMGSKKSGAVNRVMRNGM